MKQGLIVLISIILAACSARHELPGEAGTTDRTGVGMESPKDPGDVDRGDGDCIPREMDLVDFQEVQQVVFSKQCNQCHSGSSPARGIDTSNFLSVKDNLQRIFRSMESGNMPQFAPPVSDGELNLVASWMNVGAPESLDDLNVCGE